MANEENAGYFKPHRLAQHDDGPISVPLREWLKTADRDDIAALTGFAVLLALQLDAAPAGESQGETMVRLLLRHGFSGEALCC